MENRTEKESTDRLPLSEVVADCVKRWFADTLKEAKAGDINMQILLGQMYYSRYGFPEMLKWEQFGSPKSQEGLQFGKSVRSIQVIMQVILILMS